MAKYKFISEWIRDNTLNNAGAYIQWDPDSGGATLDGSFTLDELEEIVAFMKANKLPEKVLWFQRSLGVWVGNIDGRLLGEVRKLSDGVDTKYSAWCYGRGPAGSGPYDTLKKAKASVEGQLQKPE